MQLRKLALGAVLLGAVSLCSYAVGQQNAAPDTATQFTRLYNQAEGDTDQLDPLFDAYAKLPGDAAATKQAARIARIDSKKGDSSTFQIIQTMQNQKLIEQNARIIELLEKNGKK